MSDTRIIKALINQIVRDIAELPDRTSPEDWPEAMIVTADELSEIISNNLDAIECQDPDSITREELDQLRKDAEIGARWRENSSLEEWFPLTAKHMDRLRKDAERLGFLENEEACYHVTVQSQPRGDVIFSGGGRGLRDAIDREIQEGNHDQSTLQRLHPLLSKRCNTTAARR